MKCMFQCVLLFFSLMLCLLPRVETSSEDPFKMKIRNTSQTIQVSWNKPDNSRSDLCYRSQLRYRGHCDTSWQNVDDIKYFSYELPAPDMKRNYVFSVRTRLYCIDKNWSSWSPEKYWRNDRGPCVAESAHTTKDYLLVILLPLAALLLLSVISLKRVRRLVLPIIPDPKHTRKRILNIEQIQPFTCFSQTFEECEITEIEVTHLKEENLSEIIEISDKQPPPKPAEDGSCDLNLTTNASVYYIYSPDSTEDAGITPCFHNKRGYVVL